MKVSVGAGTAVAMIAALLAITITPAAAAVLTVTTTADPVPGFCLPGDCSLREAINTANASPGADTIIVPAGTYSLVGAAADDAGLTGDLDITSDMTITGAGQGATIIDLSAAGATLDRVFHVRSPGAADEIEVTIEAMTITGTKTVTGETGLLDEPGGGAVLHDGGLLLIEAVTFDANTVSASAAALALGNAASGGAIHSTGELTIANSLFNRNGVMPSDPVVGDAGAVYSTGKLTVSDTDFSMNFAGTLTGTDLFSFYLPSEAGAGGAIHAQGTVMVTGSNFRSNSAGLGLDPHGGGAIYVDESSDLLVLDSDFSNNNSGASPGGALHFNSVGEASVTTSAFAENSTFAAASGGAIYAGGPTVIIESLFLSNVAANGRPAFDHPTFGAFEATDGGSGGAIFAEAKVNISRSTLSSNSAGNGGEVDFGLTGFPGDGGDGGAVAGSNVDVAASTMSANRTGFGGFSFLDGDTGNSGDGGAVHADSSTITDSTLVANVAQPSNDPNEPQLGGKGGGVDIGAGFIGNTVLALNEAVDGPQCAGAIVSLGYNFVSDTAGCGYTSAVGDQLGVADPGLEALADNGGPTITMLPLASSPLIDGGSTSCASTDQRGEPRPFGTSCDIGAVERVTVSSLIVSPQPCVAYSSQDATAAGLDGPMSGQDVRTVQISGLLSGQGGAVACMPDGATAAVLRVSSIDPLTEGNLRMTPAGVVATGGAGVVNYGGLNGLNNTNTVTVPLSAGGAVDVQANAGQIGGVPITDPTTDVRVVVIGYYLPNQDTPLRYHPLTPCAVADSRPNKGANDDFDGPDNDGYWAVGEAFPDFDVVGDFPAGQGGNNGTGNPNGNPTSCGVPAAADSVLVNVVAIAPQNGSGHLSVGVGGSDPIDESVTGFAPLTPVVAGGFNNGATTIVTLDGGTLALDIDGDAGAAARIRVEVLGYFDSEPDGLDYSPVTPCAAFDSRTNKGATGVFEGDRLHGETHTTTYQIAGDALPVGQGGVVDAGGGFGSCEVPDDAKAVLINLEAVNALQEGNFWVAAATAAPGAATSGGVLNFNNVTPKMNNANAVVVPLSGDGKIDLEVNAGQFTADGTPITEARGVILGFYN